MKNRIIIVMVLILAAVGLVWLQKQSVQAVASVSSAETQSGEAQTGSVGAGTRIVAAMSNNMPALSSDEMQRLQSQSLALNGSSPAVPVGDTAVQRADSVPSPDSATQVSQAVEYNPQANVNAPGDMVLFRDTPIASSSLGYNTWIIGSPSTSNDRYTVFQTGNYYASVSTNAGQTFRWINPLSVFPPSYGGFAGSQISLYVPSRDAFLWELQYAPDANSGTLRIAIGSAAAILNGAWCYYDVPIDSGNFFSHPDVELSNDFLYITADRYDLGYNWNSSYIIRWPLDDMLNCAGFGYSFVSSASQSFRAVKGATDMIYWAAHLTTSEITVFNWAEDSGTYYAHNVNLSAAWNGGVGVCPGPDGRDWCGLTDVRMTAGWLAKGVLGFMWNSSQGGGFTYPYVEAVTINASDFSYIGRPFLFNPGFAFAYSAVAVNARGDVSLVTNWGGGSYYPNLAFGAWDDFTSAPPPWYIFGAAGSTQGPDYNYWGAYNSTAAFAPTNFVWDGAGFFLNGCGTIGCADPVYFIFGRARDMRSLTHYWELTYHAFSPFAHK